MAEQIVLVLTQRFDPTADLIIRELDRRCVPVVRVDAAEFPESMIMQGWIGADRHEWNGLLSTNHHTVHLADIRSIWYRRPTRFTLIQRCRPVIGLGPIRKHTLVLAVYLVRCGVDG